MADQQNWSKSDETSTHRRMRFGTCRPVPPCSGSGMTDGNVRASGRNGCGRWRHPQSLYGEGDARANHVNVVHRGL